MKKIFALFFLLSSLGLMAQVKIEDKPKNILPDLPNPVNDLEKLMTEQEQQQLTSYVNSITAAKVVVFTAPDAGFYETFNDYLLDVCAKNHFDKPGNNYVLIAISRNMMEIRILCSDSLKSKISNTAIQDIIDHEIIPEFKDSHFLAGLQKAAEAIKQRL